MIRIIGSCLALVLSTKWISCMCCSSRRRPIESIWSTYIHMSMERSGIYGRRRMIGRCLLAARRLRVMAGVRSNWCRWKSEIKKLSKKLKILSSSNRRPLWAYLDNSTQILPIWMTLLMTILWFPCNGKITKLLKARRPRSWSPATARDSLYGISSKASWRMLSKETSFSGNKHKELLSANRSREIPTTQISSPSPMEKDLSSWIWESLEIKEASLKMKDTCTPRNQFWIWTTTPSKSTLWQP